MKKGRCTSGLNIQTIPKQDKTVKRAFIPKHDALLSCDYPNIELKLLAYYLQQIGYNDMAHFFVTDDEGDLHKRTAAGMFDKEMADVTDDERQIAKRLNFSIVYGGGAPTLLRQGAAADFDEAAEMLYAFHQAWPGIGWESPIKKHYSMPVEAAPGTLLDLVKHKVATKGYITTLWGRHLHPRAAHSSLNALIQGCAADLMKWACVQVWRRLKEKQFTSEIVNVVHDDMILDCINDELPILAKRVPELMTFEPVQAVVPIKPEPEVSYTNWAELQPYEGG